MDRQLQQRAWRTDFDVADAEGRIVSGIAVPFNSPTQVFERGRLFSETWAPGSTREHIQKRGNRMRLLGFHASRSFPLGKFVGLEDRKVGMWIEAQIANTRDGNDALELARMGALDGFSVGFSVPEGGETWNRDETERTITRANVHEVSLVNFPAFDDARVEAIRSARDASDGSGVDVVAPHAYISLNNPIICDVCGLPEDDHSDGHTLTLPFEDREDADTSAGDDLDGKRFRLQILRAEILRPRSMT